MSLEHFTPKSPNPSIGKSIGDNQLAVLGQLNELVDAINNINQAPRLYADIATTGAIVLATTGLTAIDGVTPVAGTKVLVKDQATASQNGTYVASLGPWIRTADVFTAGTEVYVESGTANALTVWTLTTPDPIVIGTTSLIFTATAGGDALLVHKAGTETITGNKSFTAAVNLTAAGSRFYRNVDNLITAATTQTNTAATQLTGMLSRIAVCANNRDGVKLGAATKGSTQKVTNEGAKACAVYPMIGQFINNLTVAVGTDTPTTSGASVIYLPSGATMEFICTLDGVWRVNVDRGQVFIQQISLTNAQILTLYTAPILAISATGKAKEVIMPISATMSYTRAVASYATNTELDLIHYGSSNAILKTSIAGGASTFSPFISAVSATPSGTVFVANADLNIFVPLGNPTGGNVGSSIKITIAYMILEAI